MFFKHNQHFQRIIVIEKNKNKVVPNIPVNKIMMGNEEGNLKL